MGGLAVTSDPASAAFLRSESAAGKDHIGRIIPAEELQRYAPGLASSLVAVEPAEHYMFGFGAPGNDRRAGAPAPPPSYVGPPGEKGNHGFWPARHDYGSVFLLYGPGVAARHLPRIEMVGIKDRLAQVLGVQCP